MLKNTYHHSPDTGRDYFIDSNGLASPDLLGDEADEYFDEDALRRDAEIAAWEAGGRDVYHAWDRS